MLANVDGTTHSGASLASQSTHNLASNLGILGTVQAAASSANSPEPRLLYDRKEAARQLSISVRSLDYLISGKKLAFRRIGKKVLIPHGELVRFSRANHYESVHPNQDGCS